MPPLSRGFQRLRVAYNLAVPRFQVLKRFQSAQPLGSRNDVFKISEEVQEALETRRPVVALETAIYTHGELDAIVRPEIGTKRSHRLSLS